MLSENEKIEYKSEISDSLCNEIVAFLNTSGGVLYIGVDNDGKRVGIENIKYEYENLVNTFKANYDIIKKLLKSVDEENYENRRSLVQDLHFSYAKMYFEKEGIEFDKTKFIQLGIINKEDSLYTNLAYIISDECAWTTKIAIYEDNANTNFIDRREFNGSVFKQIDDALSYLDLNNKTKSTFQGAKRIDKRDYPEIAIREAYINAIIHREYSFSGSVIININSVNMEIISLGGLVNGLKKEDILIGVSETKNKKLAAIFYRLKLIEAYGTGLKRIFAVYKKYGLEPEIFISENSFKIILQNLNNEKESIKNDGEIITKRDVLSKQEIEILNYISEKNEIEIKDIIEKFSVKKTRAYAILKSLIQKNKIYKRKENEKIVYMCNMN